MTSHMDELAVAAMAAFICYVKNLLVLGLLELRFEVVTLYCEELCLLPSIF